jgi:FKBP-type peptidyl-prolyl cis-trans isomerase
MFRVLLAAFAALALAACQPSIGKIDEQDPFKSLHPWNHNWKEVQKLPSGVEYVVIHKGDGKGAFPSPADKVKVHYDGRQAKSGEAFDSSYDEDPVTFRLNTVIPGWQYGLGKMQAGDEVMFWIPWRVAYGEEGYREIPPKTDLMFRVELFDVVPAVSADPDAWAKVTPWPTGSSDIHRQNSGLEYVIIESGPDDALSATDRDYVNLHVEGRIDGDQMDDGEPVVVQSTYADQETVRYPVGDLTPGWNELMHLMRPGDHWMVMMPPHLMYGEEGDGRIPPNATVVYEVRLDSVIYIEAPPADPPK